MDKKETGIQPATAPTLADLDRIQGRLSRKPYEKPTVTTQDMPAGMAQLAMDRATYAAIKTGQDSTTPLHSELAPDASVTASKELSERFHAADSEAKQKRIAGEEVEGYDEDAAVKDEAEARQQLVKDLAAEYQRSYSLPLLDPLKTLVDAHKEEVSFKDMDPQWLAEQHAEFTKADQEWREGDPLPEHILVCNEGEADEYTVDIRRDKIRERWALKLKADTMRDHPEAWGTPEAEKLLNTLVAKQALDDVLHTLQYPNANPQYDQSKEDAPQELVVGDERHDPLHSPLYKTEQNADGTFDVHSVRDALSAPPTKVEICRTKTRLLKCLDYITSFADILIVYAPTEELAKSNPLQTLSIVRVYDDKQALVSINPEQPHATFNASVYQFPSNLMEALLEGLAALGFAYMITKQEGVLLCVRSFDPEAAAKNPELLERKPLTKLSLVPQALVDDFDEGK